MFIVYFLLIIYYLCLFVNFTDLLTNVFVILEEFFFFLSRPVPLLLLCSFRNVQLLIFHVSANFGIVRCKWISGQLLKTNTQHAMTQNHKNWLTIFSNYSELAILFETWNFWSKQELKLTKIEVFWYIYDNLMIFKHFH